MFPLYLENGHVFLPIPSSCCVLVLRTTALIVRNTEPLAVNTIVPSGSVFSATCPFFWFCFDGGRVQGDYLGAGHSRRQQGGFSRQRRPRGDRRGPPPGDSQAALRPWRKLIPSEAQRAEEAGRSLVWARVSLSYRPRCSSTSTRSR